MKTSKRYLKQSGLWLGVTAFAVVLWSSFAAHAEGSGEIDVASTFISIAALLVFARIAGSLVERFGQPGVLGELVLGVILGNVVLAGFDWFEPLKHDPNITFLAQLGVVVLLFQVGLESNVKEMMKVGVRAFMVATVGVVVPFVLGTRLVGPMLLPGLDFAAYLFLGAALTATSVGITARVFQDLGKSQTPEAKIVLGAAVIDDVMGLVVLAVVSAIVTVGSVSGLSIAWIIAKATLFLLGAIVVGQLTAPQLGKWLSKIHTGNGMKFTLAIAFALVFSYLAQKIGLAPIVGAFAAGLVLDPVHFQHFRQPEIAQKIKAVIAQNGAAADTQMVERIEAVVETHEEHHVERLIQPVGFLLVPIFFVMVGMEVKIETLFNPAILFTALGITAAAFIGKIMAGAVAGKNVNRWIVGWGMVPRGEVGLIFAVTGKAMGVVNDSVYSVIVVVVTLSTLLIPPVLAQLLKRHK